MRRTLVALLVAAGSVGVGAAAATVPSDPDATHPAYAAVNLPAAWDITTGSPEIVIAIVDSGVDATHPELAGAVLPGYDFVADRDDATPVDGGEPDQRHRIRALVQAANSVGVGVAPTALTRIVS